MYGKGEDEDDLYNFRAHDKRKFHEHNMSLIRFKDDYLIVSRLDNSSFVRSPILNNGIRVGQFVLNKYHRNFLSIQYGSSEPKILKMPNLDGFHPMLKWWSQYEDGRLYFEEKTKRLYLTATVFTPDNVRIGLAELNVDTFEVKHAHVLRMESKFAQKNWNLFADHHKKTFILTDLYPELVVQNIDLDAGIVNPYSKVSSKEVLEHIGRFFHIRCSSGMIRWTSNTLLTISHIREKKANKYRSVFIEVEDVKPFRPLQCSQILTFVRDLHDIEFVSSICWDKTHSFLKIGLGIDDNNNRIVDFPKDLVFEKRENLYHSFWNEMIRK